MILHSIWEWYYIHTHEIHALLILYSLWEWYYIIIHEIHVLLILHSLWGLMGPHAAKSGTYLAGFHARRIPNFVIISVLGLWRPVPALSRSKDLQDRSPQGYLQGFHAPRAPAGWRQDRTYFQMYFHAIQRFNPLWFGHWLRQILFFKSLNNTSFPQQPICSSCTACAPNILCALCAPLLSGVTLGTSDTARSRLRMHLAQLGIQHTWHDNMVHFQDSQCFFSSALSEFKWYMN